MRAIHLQDAGIWQPSFSISVSFTEAPWMEYMVAEGSKPTSEVWRPTCSSKLSQPAKDVSIWNNRPFQKRLLCHEMILVEQNYLKVQRLIVVI